MIININFIYTFGHLKRSFYIYYLKNINIKYHNTNMAYQQCSKNVILLLQSKYPNKNWKETKKHKTIMEEILRYLGRKCLLLDDEICFKVYTNVYNGLTIANYIVPLIDIDIDPSLREFNEYDKNYDDCVIEEENNFQFNLS